METIYKCIKFIKNQKVSFKEGEQVIIGQEFPEYYYIADVNYMKSMSVHKLVFGKHFEKLK